MKLIKCVCVSILMSLSIGLSGETTIGSDSNYMESGLVTITWVSWNSSLIDRGCTRVDHCRVYISIVVRADLAIGEGASAGITGEVHFSRSSMPVLEWRATGPEVQMRVHESNYIEMPTGFLVRGGLSLRFQPYSDLVVETRYIEGMTVCGP